MDTEPCIFCPNPRTTKRGEHVWDDWLNREDGKEIRRPSSATHLGVGGALIRTYPTDRLEVTLPVICERCNNEWMSDLSSRAKPLLEPIIRRDHASDFTARDIVVIAAFAFMKSAVLDWSATSNGRKPCISRTACLAFRESLTSPSSRLRLAALPDGLQVWIARYRRTHVMEAQAFTEEMTGTRQFKGYRILVITYVVGSFIFQLTHPRWVKARRNRPPPPFFEVLGDVLSVPIWPGVIYAYWPPLAHVDGRSLESFQERFRRVRIIQPNT